MSEEFRCGTFVASRIRQLLSPSPDRLSPWGRAMLAQLRQAAGQDPGTVPAVWAITAEGVPDLPPTRERRVETAIHIALTQFAIHQQARSASMHAPDRPFGRTVRRLAEGAAGSGTVYDTPIYQRFTAMATATHLDGLVTHARGLVTQMRAADLAFDYRRFADDLYWFQVPGHAAGVRRGWGRDFHYLTRETTDHTDNTDTTEGVPA